MSPTTVTGEAILETFGASWWTAGAARGGRVWRGAARRHGATPVRCAAREGVRIAMRSQGGLGSTAGARCAREGNHENLLEALAQLHHLLLLQELHVAASLDAIVQVQHPPPGSTRQHGFAHGHGHDPRLDEGP